MIKYEITVTAFEDTNDTNSLPYRGEKCGRVTCVVVVGKHKQLLSSMMRTAWNELRTKPFEKTEPND